MPLSKYYQKSLSFVLALLIIIMAINSIPSKTLIIPVYGETINNDQPSNETSNETMPEINPEINFSPNISIPKSFFQAVASVCFILFIFIFVAVIYIITGIYRNYKEGRYYSTLLRNKEER